MPHTPRIFTPLELTHSGEWLIAFLSTLSPTDLRDYQALRGILPNEDAYLAGDYDLIGSNRRYELGE